MSPRYVSLQQEFVNVWIFVFLGNPGKTEHFYWLRTKELCWAASAVSFNFFFTFLSSSSIFSWLFSAALKVFFGFSQQLQKLQENSNVLNKNGSVALITWHIRSAFCTLSQVSCLIEVTLIKGLAYLCVFVWRKAFFVIEQSIKVFATITNTAVVP